MATTSFFFDSLRIPSYSLTSLKRSKAFFQLISNVFIIERRVCLMLDNHVELMRIWVFDLDRQSAAGGDRLTLFGSQLRVRRLA